jgi:preprotein translocase subunit YajC
VKGLLPILLIFVVFYVVLILPQSRRRKQAQALQRNVEPGARVMLTSGLYGTIAEIDDDVLVVEIADGVLARFAKAAVLRVLPEDVDETEETEETDSEDLDSHAEGDDGHDADPGSVPRA